MTEIERYSAIILSSHRSEPHVEFQAKAIERLVACLEKDGCHDIWVAPLTWAPLDDYLVDWGWVMAAYGMKDEEGDG